MEVEDRILGCIFGGAVGDAFGYPLEFLSLGEILDRFGPERATEPGEHISDDTQMTLFTIEGLIAARREEPGPDDDVVVKNVFEAYLRWAHTQGELTNVDVSWGLCTEPALCLRRAPGTTCLESLAAGVPGTTSEPPNDSKGSGGIMRVAPIGLFPGWDVQRVFQLGCEVAALTHGHPSGWLAAGAFACVLRVLLEGQDMAHAIDVARELLQGSEDSEEVLEAIDAVPDAQEVGNLGEGWVAEEALAIAVHAAGIGSDLADVMMVAANHSGDSDTTASLAGQLYGARHGVGAIPSAWIDELDAVESIDRMTTRLVDLATE